MALLAISAKCQISVGLMRTVVKIGLVTIVTFDIQSGEFIFDLADVARFTIQGQMSAG